MKPAQIAHIKGELGAILNLVRYKSPSTVEEAIAQLELIDQTALAALTQLEEALFASGRGAQLSTTHYPKQPRSFGQSRGLQELTSKSSLRSLARAPKKRKAIGDHRR